MSRFEFDGAKVAALSIRQLHRSRARFTHAPENALTFPNRSTAMLHHLFVYGTLAPGRSNAHELAGIAGTWRSATVRGTVLADGWGAAAGYPGIVLDEAAGPVHGLVFSSEELPSHWPRLDEFEGDGYVRVPVSATLDDGTALVAQVYALREYPGGPVGND